MLLAHSTIWRMDMGGEVVSLATLAGRIGSICAFVWGVYTYGDQRTQDNKDSLPQTAT
jgi:hypothetical protein